MKRYTTPEIVIVELDGNEIAVMETSNLYVDPRPAEDGEFAPYLRGSRGSSWEDYEQ